MRLGFIPSWQGKRETLSSLVTSANSTFKIFVITFDSDLFFCSYWRVASNLHTHFQTLVGAVLGCGMAWLAISLEGRFIGAFGVEIANRPVPLLVRALVVGSGAVVLYRKK